MEIELKQLIIHEEPRYLLLHLFVNRFMLLTLEQCHNQNFFQMDKVESLTDSIRM